MAARHSSFTRAAQELCVTQGAVSKQVKHLEAFVGVELFLRIRQGLVLTEAGRAYLAKIQAGLGQIEAATVELIAHQARRHAEPDLYAHIRARWLIPRLTAFMRQRPDIHVEFLPHRQGYDFSTPSWTPPCASAKARSGSGADYIVGRDIVPVYSPRLIPGGCRPEDLLAYPLLHHTSALDGWRDWFEQAGCDTRRSLEGARFDQRAVAGRRRRFRRGVDPALSGRGRTARRPAVGRRGAADPGAHGLLPVLSRTESQPADAAGVPRLADGSLRAAEPRPDEEAAADALK